MKFCKKWFTLRIFFDTKNINEWIYINNWETPAGYYDLIVSWRHCWYVYVRILHARGHLLSKPLHSFIALLAFLYISVRLCTVKRWTNNDFSFLLHYCCQGPFVLFYSIKTNSIIAHINTMIGSELISS